ncbi:transporter substrate-binding domain-containing protein [Deltaproteobacteria bacterium OttesenSCG-928-M10]|nr:transporter substrate-binding domain-containing protein [Deltaproteobacteria bacterium OttesenSCG-928-M10]
MTRKLLLWLAIFMLSASSARAQDKVYTFAVDTYYPPFSYTDEKTGELAGFDVDIAKAVCGKLGLKCEVIAVPFDEIIPQVEAGRIDVGCAGFAYTEERAKRIIYTAKYFRSSSLFLELPGTFDGITPETVKGKKVAVQASTNQEDYLRHTYGEVIEVVPVKGFDDIIKGVNDKTYDLGFIDGLPGYHHLKSDEGLSLDIVGDPVHLDDGSCMVLQKGREALRDRINQAIEDLRLSGAYDAINIKYFDFNVY